MFDYQESKSDYRIDQLPKMIKINGQLIKHLVNNNAIVVGLMSYTNPIDVHSAPLDEWCMRYITSAS